MKKTPWIAEREFVEHASEGAGCGVETGAFGWA
jgi:hypothetical protein